MPISLITKRMAYKLYIQIKSSSIMFVNCRSIQLSLVWRIISQHLLTNKFLKLSIFSRANVEIDENIGSILVSNLLWEQHLFYPTVVVVLLWIIWININIDYHSKRRSKISLCWNKSNFPVLQHSSSSTIVWSHKLPFLLSTNRTHVSTLDKWQSLPSQIGERTVPFNRFLLFTSRSSVHNEKPPLLISMLLWKSYQQSGVTLCSVCWRCRDSNQILLLSSGTDGRPTQ